MMTNETADDLPTSLMRALLVSMLHVIRDAPATELEIKDRAVQAIAKLVVLLEQRAHAGDGDAIAAMQEFNDWFERMPVVTAPQ